jgi:hypothetical protein
VLGVYRFLLTGQPLSAARRALAVQAGSAAAGAFALQEAEL